jgi:hypothetical protein
LDMDSDKSESSTEEDEEDLLFCWYLVVTY